MLCKWTLNGVYGRESVMEYCTAKTDWVISSIIRTDNKRIFMNGWMKRDTNVLLLTRTVTLQVGLHLATASRQNKLIWFRKFKNHHSPTIELHPCVWWIILHFTPNIGSTNSIMIFFLAKLNFMWYSHTTIWTLAFVLNVNPQIKVPILIVLEQKIVQYNKCVYQCEVKCLVWYYQQQCKIGDM